MNIMILIWFYLHPEKIEGEVHSHYGEITQLVHNLTPFLYTPKQMEYVVIDRLRLRRPEERMHITP